MLIEGFSEVFFSKKNLKIFFGILLILLINIINTPFSVAQTYTFCEGITKILDDTPNMYNNLRGDFDFYMNEYKGRLILPGLNECYTSQDKHYSAEYECSIRKLPDFEEDVKKRFLKFKQEIAACLNENFESKKTYSDTKIKFFNHVGGEEITLSYRRHIPKNNRSPYYVIQFKIYYSEKAAN